MYFWDHACWYSAKWVCCPMCDKDKCTPHSDDCDAEKWYKEHIEDYKEDE